MNMNVSTVNSVSNEDPSQALYLRHAEEVKAERELLEWCFGQSVGLVYDDKM